ncbi:aminoglycoside phosphotransferase family protein [Streptomyces sp. NPDC054802]
MTDLLGQSPYAPTVGASAPTSWERAGMHCSAADFMTMYETAMRQGVGIQGFYHRNVQVNTEADSYMIRVPMDGSEIMDLAIWPEHEILSAIQPHLSRAPRLLHVHDRPYFQVQGYIEGDTVETIYPPGSAIPPVIADDISVFFSELFTVPESGIPRLPVDWPSNGDSQSFASVLLGLGRSLRDDHGEKAPELFANLGIPVDPFCALEGRVPDLAARPFHLLHGDLHRGNMIWDSKRTFLLDWQLSLWGDPVYELADHLHKMEYTPEDRKRAVQSWLKVAPGVCTRRWEQDLDFYLAYEQVKSSVVDTVRWSRRIATSEAGSPARDQAIRELAAKINRARPHWSSANRCSGDVTADRVAKAVADFHRLDGDVGR